MGIIYKIDSSTFDIIGDCVNMDEWLNSIGDNELNSLYRICLKKSNARNSEENLTIFKLAITIYCRELDIDSLSIDDGFVENMKNIFSKNIIVKVLSKNNKVIDVDPILMYKKYNYKIKQ